MTWTVELRSIDRESPGSPAEWISSGLPTQQPAPERMTADLLRERGLLLLPVDPIDPVDPVDPVNSVEFPPRTRSRRLIGYATRDPELMQLAVILAKVLDAECDHAMIVASRWIQGGYTADAALRWVTAGVTTPSGAAVHKHP